MTALAEHSTIVLERLGHESGLHHVMDRQNVVGQAQGLLMERYGLDAGRALDVLRGCAEHTHTDVDTVAAQLIAARHLTDYHGPTAAEV